MNYGVVNKIVKQTYKHTKYIKSFHYLIIEQLHLTLHAFHSKTLPQQCGPRV